MIISGLFSPGNSPGIVTITGDLTVDGSDGKTIDDSYPEIFDGNDTVGTIEIEIGGYEAGPGPDDNPDNGHDQINVLGHADLLGGTLRIVLININNFNPKDEDTFEISSYGSVGGDFVNPLGIDIGNGLTFKPRREETRYLPEVVADISPTAQVALQEGLNNLPAWLQEFEADQNQKKPLPIFNTSAFEIAKLSQLVKETLADQLR